MIFIVFFKCIESYGVFFDFVCFFWIVYGDEVVFGFLVGVLINNKLFLILKIMLNNVLGSSFY